MEQKAWKTKCAVPGQGTAHVEADAFFRPQLPEDELWRRTPDEGVGGYVRRAVPHQCAAAKARIQVIISLCLPHPERPEPWGWFPTTRSGNRSPRV